ncbi:MAG: flavodoxin family protein, partial [Limisphaerales bacterium]
ADAVVFATPVYWFSVSARMKALLERMTSMENQGLLNLGKPMVLLAVAEEEAESQYFMQPMNSSEAFRRMAVPEPTTAERELVF